MTRDEIKAQEVVADQSALESCCVCGGGKEMLVMQGGETVHAGAGVNVIGDPPYVVADNERATLTVDGDGTFVTILPPAGDSQQSGIAFMTLGIGRYQQTVNGSFSAVSKPIFGSKC